MKPFDLLFPDVLPWVPGCPEPTAEHALLRAAQRFCELSRCWRVVLDPTTVAPDTDEYDLDLPGGTELVRIESAKLYGRDLRVARPNEQLGRRERFLETSDARTFHLNPMPSGDGEVMLTVTLKPGNCECGLEDFVMDRYGELIAKGAVAQLMQHPGKTYSNPEGAARWQDFEARALTERNKIERGLGREAVRTVSNFF